MDGSFFFFLFLFWLLLLKWMDVFLNTKKTSSTDAIQIHLLDNPYKCLPKKTFPFFILFLFLFILFFSGSPRKRLFFLCLRHRAWGNDQPVRQKKNFKKKKELWPQNQLSKGPFGNEHRFINATHSKGLVAMETAPKNGMSGHGMRKRRILLIPLIPTWRLSGNAYKRKGPPLKNYTSISF